MNDLERKAAEAVTTLLANVPALHIDRVKNTGHDQPYDILAEVTVGPNHHRLVFEVKSIGQPRHVRAALLQLRKAAESFDPPATPVFVAPYLSPESQALCREYDVGFLDLIGNARVSFDTVFIERYVGTTPPPIQRGLKSVFKPKSAQILRVLLRHPERVWRVADLSRCSQVSLGQVSNVRTELVDREWAEVTDGGLRLSRPGALLEAWREVYEPPAGERLSFYTVLHGKQFESATRSVLSGQAGGQRSAFASFSAAQWLAPYGRVSTQFFYASREGARTLQDALKLSPVSSGGNVVVTVPKDEGVLLDIVEPAPGVVCTSAVQTYLDLSHAGERGEEAADHLKQELLSWPK